MLLLFSSATPITPKFKEQIAFSLGGAKAVGGVWFREAEIESVIVVPEPQSKCWLPSLYGKALLTSVITSYIRCWMLSRVASSVSLI